MVTEPVKVWLDAGSIGVAIAALFQALPHIAALASLIWLSIRIYETDTFQSFLNWVKPPSRAKLKAIALVTEAKAEAAASVAAAKLEAIKLVNKGEDHKDLNDRRRDIP